MKDLLKYKGYRASIRYSEEDGCFIGDVLGIDDIIAFDGQNLQELRQMFKESIDSYLENCAAWGKKPDREYKGTFNVRVTPQIHGEAVRCAEEEGISLNQFVSTAIQEKLDRTKPQYAVTSASLRFSESPVQYAASPAARDDAEILEVAARVIRKYQAKE